MSILSCNCRGAGIAMAVRELRDLARNFALTLLCVVETQIEGTRVENLAGTIGYDNSYAVSSQGRSGGLGIFWNNPIKIDTPEQGNDEDHVVGGRTQVYTRWI